MARDPRDEAAASGGTRHRIVAAAIELFNERGVGAVTTNHLAAHLKISPGNLYYHFHNKEEIVREAFEWMNADADEVWRVDGAGDEPGRGDPAALQRMLVGNLKLFAKYLFFARELPSLLRSDPVLHERYLVAWSQRVDQLEAVIRPLLDAGLLRNVGDAEDLRALVESAWMLALFCIPYGETLEPPSFAALSVQERAARTRAAVEKGALRVLHVFKPYMDPLAYVALVVILRTELEKLELA